MPTYRTTYKRCCSECGTEFVAKRSHAEFCRTACKTAFNNRRFRIGAVFFDLFMAIRYERDLAKALQLWSVLCRLAEQTRQDDIDKRGGRKSWGNVKEWIMNNPWASVTRLPRTVLGRMAR